MPTSAAPLDSIIHKLYDLIHNIVLPKTKTAKTAAITVQALHATCSLVTSVHTLLPVAHHENPVLNNLVLNWMQPQRSWLSLSYPL